MTYGFVKVAAAVPEVRIADCTFNAAKIKELMNKAKGEGVQFMVFPELCLTAYTCGDLFCQEALLSNSEEQLGLLLEETTGTHLVSIIGMPVRNNGRLFNCGVVIQDGKILGIVPKTYLPGCEERWFTSGAEVNGGLLSEVNGSLLRICGQDALFGTDIIFRDENDSRICFGVELCEDLWAPLPPSSRQAVAGATLLFNLSASNELIGRHEYRKTLITWQSARCISAYVYAACGPGESTTDKVFGGYAMIAENGATLSESPRFIDGDRLIYSEIDVEKLVNDRMKNAGFMKSPADGLGFREIGFKTAGLQLDRLSRYIDPHPFVPRDKKEREERCKEVFDIQVSGLAGRLRNTGIDKAVIGVSGGLDSTLALLVAAKAFDRLGLDRKNITAINMPGFGTSYKTYQNAAKLINAMNVTGMDIDIREACLKHFADIGHDPAVHDTTYENVQARERTQILMDVANKVGGLVIGTGDLSEMALGWSTYNGDHMSMYSVNCGVPKTLVRHMAEWAADNVVGKEAGAVICSILDTPVSPELLPPDEQGNICQQTEKIIGPYELHDFFLYHTIRHGASPRKVLFLAKHAFESKYPDEEIKKWLMVFIKRFFSQQFKRSCTPDGPMVGSVSLSPRGAWKMPSDASAQAWLSDLDRA